MLDDITTTPQSGTSHDGADAPIEVWTVTLDVPPGVVDRCARDLAGDERARARRYHTATQRRRFIVRRAVLRRILAHASGRPATELRFTPGPLGKPALAGATLQFNQSASGERSVVAVSRAHPVGIDVERIDPELGWGELLPGCCSATERAALTALRADQQRLGFFACWTRKEAYLKACGVGLSGPALTEITVDVDPAQGTTHVHVEGRPQERHRWTCRTLQIAPEYASALVTVGTADILLVEWGSHAL